MTAGSVFGISRMAHEIMDSKKDRGQCDIESENLFRAVLYWLIWKTVKHFSFL